MIIRVDDDDNINANDLLDRVIINQRLAVSSSYSSVKSVLGFYKKVTMDFRFRVMCDANYYGSNCGRVCVPQDSDTLGHYECDANGERVCLADYTGVDCLTREWVRLLVWLGWVTGLACT